MSADLWIECKTCGCDGCGKRDVNITYNLTPMLTAAGFTGWQSLIGKPASEAGTYLIRLLDEMATDPDRWRAMNPASGWGDYDRTLQVRLREWAQHCCSYENPQMVIGGSL